MTRSEIEALVADSVAKLPRQDRRNLVASWPPMYKETPDGWLLYDIGGGDRLAYSLDDDYFPHFPWCIVEGIRENKFLVDTACESFEDCCDAVVERAERRSRPEPPRPKATRPPKLFPINHDEYHARHMGTTEDGRRFFLTNPFVPAGPSGPGCEYIALFLFDKLGRFIEARIDELGPRDQVDPTAAQSLYDDRLTALGNVTFQRIKVAPFEVVQFNTTFGFIAIAPHSNNDEWSIELHPGNYMAFYPPFNGDYDT